MQTVGVIDIGISNISSVINALKFLDAKVGTVRGPEDLVSFDKLVLPGVGSFPAGMRRLSEGWFDEALIEQVSRGRYLLGICLGMHLLADRGSEFEITKGLGLIPGEVKKLQFESDSSFRVPHIGWNDVEVKPSSVLCPDVSEGCFYFCHSYKFVPNEKCHIAAQTNYGEVFPSMIEKENIIGVQFHPEKSQKFGLKLLHEFICL
tara:strand:- start:119 stop:733 length:615 start_codon:yes stop_codon:yes gene_type:complete